MKITSYTEARQHFAAMLDRVADDHEEVVITRPGREPVVVVTLAEYESMRETLHVLGGRTNTRRLLDAMDAADRGEVVHVTVQELAALGDETAAA